LKGSLNRSSAKAKMQCRFYTKDLNQDTLAQHFIIKPVLAHTQFLRCKYNLDILKME